MENGDGDPSSSDVPEEEDTDEEEQQFDITLAASHSYMGSSLMEVSGRSVLEAGWQGRVPVMAHHSCVFPGETVPMLLTNAHDKEIMLQAIRNDKLFGLLCPDESGTLVSGFGVMCEVFEAASDEASLSFKARATHRFRLINTNKEMVPLHFYSRARVAAVRVLPELTTRDPLRLVRLTSLDSWRGAHARNMLDTRLRSMDSAVTQWPLFVYEMFDYPRMRRVIQDYFSTFMMDKLPADPVSLSFWVASNLSLPARDRLALFLLDNALLRLHLQVLFIRRQKSLLCCTSCGAEIARREHIFAMSSDGVHSNYTNLGGYMHDVVTVSRVRGVASSGGASSEYSWFPGYRWRCVACAACSAHLGWRFEALKRNLRPQRFYGLCRNYVQPRGDDTPHSPAPPTPPPPPEDDTPSLET